MKSLSNRKQVFFLWSFVASNAFAMASAGGCLPKIFIPKEYKECKTDADCVVAGDGCRSCQQDLWIVNKAWKESLESLDRDRREKAKCVLTCEACSTQWVKPVCVMNSCANSANRSK